MMRLIRPLTMIATCSDTDVATPATALSQLTTPVLVAVGELDQPSADQLAAALPNARLARVPGDHFSALAGPEFANAVTDFLASS